MQIQIGQARDLDLLFIDSADHITGKAALSSFTVYASKACGTPAAITPTITELDATNYKGHYKVALTAAHLDTLGDFGIKITATGMDPFDARFEVVNLLQGGGLARGTVGSSATTTSIPTSAFTPAPANADQLKSRILTFDNNTATAALRGEQTDITASTNSATPTLTVTALSAAPASGDTFFIA